MFPRGPGSYLNLFVLVPVLLSYLLWVRACWWVDQDARRLGLLGTPWSLVIFVLGLLGLLVFWAFPWFIIAFVVMLALWITPTACYVVTRNALLPEEEKVWTPLHISMLLERYFRIKLRREEAVETGPDFILLDREGDTERDDSPRLRNLARARGYPQVIQMLYDAVQRRATDVHLEPATTEVQLRWRIDGVLRARPPLSRGAGETLAQVVKSAAGLEVTERRKPQDGHFSAKVNGRRVDFRVHCAGTTVGQRLSLRIHDRARRILGLDGLGMSEVMQHQMNGVLRREHGLFLLCGPADSGKTTTAYACLQEIDRFQKSILTVEAPIDYRLPNIDQYEIDPKAGQNFATELQNLLRRVAADVIFIGELRDRATAELACKKAQGTPLFSTLPAPDALTGLVRLVEFAVPTAKSVLTGVLAQRLVRVLCSHCKVRYQPQPELLRKANLPTDKIKHFCRPPRESEMPHDQRGQLVICEHCHGIGYHGRTGVFELLLVTDPIRELLSKDLSFNAIKQEALKGGMVPLHDDAMRLVVKGVTSIDEVLRVLREETKAR